MSKLRFEENKAKVLRELKIQKLAAEAKLESATKDLENVGDGEDLAAESFLSHIRDYEAEIEALNEEIDATNKITYKV